MKIDVQKLTHMLELQKDVNLKIDGGEIKNHDYLLAVVVECGEAIEHHGYKWWKKHEPDMDQLRMEVVDIWHFYLSDSLLPPLSSGITINPKHLAELIIECCDDECDPNSSIIELIKMIALEACEGDVRYDALCLLTEKVGMSFSDLYKAYVGKNVLNEFRQNNGYADGPYIKTWDGREDNEVLTDILCGLSGDEPNFALLVYNNLGVMYCD